VTTILGLDGQPLSPRQVVAAPALREQQTANLLHLQRELADHPARGLTPARVNDLLDAADRGDITRQHELYLDMEERCAHLFAEMNKRRSAVVRLDWRITPARNATAKEEADAQWLTEVLQDIQNFEDVLLDLLDGIGHGFAALEIEWQLVGREWRTKRLMHRPQSWFRFDDETRTELRLRDHSATGAPLQPLGWIVHRHQAKSGYPSRSGLHRVTIWPFLYLAYGVGDFAELLEINGIPLRLGKYPPTATNDERSTLLRAVAGIGHAAAGIVPQGMDIEFITAANSTGEAHERMISWAEGSISKAVVGQTLSADSKATGLGSGVADLHHEVKQDIRDSDARQLAGTLTRDLLWPLLVLNRGGGDPMRAPRLVFDTKEPEDLKTYAESLPLLVAIGGMRIPPKWVHEKLNIPMAEPNDPVLTVQTKPPASPSEPSGAAALRTAALTGTNANAIAPDQAALDAAQARLTLGALAEQWLSPAVAALNRATSYEEALRMLAEDAPLIDMEVLGEALGRAMFASEAHGFASLKFEVAQDLATPALAPVAPLTTQLAAQLPALPDVHIHLAPQASGSRTHRFDHTTGTWVSEDVAP
jgi:phage gp29-like protein